MGRILVLALALFLLNAHIVRELFTIEYLDEMGSIEAAYVALARYITDNWGDLTWFPLWYTGVPFQNTYPPLLHLTVAAAAGLTGASPALAYHAVSATFYGLGAVTLFWLAYQLSGSLSRGLAAGLIYSLLSPSAFLIAAVRHDIQGPFHARRLQTLVHYGEGPHVASLALLPAAIACLDLAVRRRRPGWYLLAAIAVAATVLTNWLGAFGLAAAAVSYLLARPADARAWLRAGCIGAGAYLLAAPWIPPSTIGAIGHNAQRVGGPYALGARHLLYAALLLVGLTLANYWMKRAKLSPGMRFAANFSLLMGVITLASEWGGVDLVPQPHRYHLELEMGLALVVAFALPRLFESLGGRERAAVLAALVLFTGVQWKTYRGYARGLNRPLDMRARIEYKTARWMDGNMNGARVFVPGATSFWLNAFTDTPQFNGGFDQGIVNRLIPGVAFQVLSGMGAGERENEVGIAWLKVYGVAAVAVGGPNSGEHYKPFTNPNKFKDALPELWRDGDDVVYAVPAAAMARAIRPEHLVIREPRYLNDIELLRPYLAAVDDPTLPRARFTWRSRHQATIQADLRVDHLLSVLIAYHHGWRAHTDGRRVAVRRDHLGMMIVEPGCNGPCTVELIYDGGAEMKLARAGSWITLAGTLAWIAAGVWKRRNRPTP